LCNQHGLYHKARAEYGVAEPLYRRALTIDEASYGPDHPDVARDLNNLAELLRTTNRAGEAEPLYRRALAIDEASYGPDHPTVAIRLGNLAQLLWSTNRAGEAELLARRAVKSFTASLPEGHPHIDIAREIHAGILAGLGGTSGMSGPANVGSAHQQAPSVQPAASAPPKRGLLARLFGR
ncbi:MAG: tetratricopeptide repeat protein, partial [Pseudomonadota bacterium]